jgi:hypothetical protein
MGQTGDTNVDEEEWIYVIDGKSRRQETTRKSKM